MSITPERIMELDAEVREIGAYLGMAFDEEYAEKQERKWNYQSQVKYKTKMISFSTGEYKNKDRWIIRAEFPNDDKGQSQFYSYYDKYPEITVSRSKTPKKIAMDIKLRLMPNYEKLLAEVLFKIELSNRYHASKLAQITKVAEFLGLQKTDLREDSAIFPEGKRGVYKIEPYDKDSVKFDVTVSADKAIEILKLLGY